MSAFVFSLPFSVLSYSSVHIRKQTGYFQTTSLKKNLSDLGWIQTFRGLGETQIKLKRAIHAMASQVWGGVGELWGQAASVGEIGGTVGSAGG